jgi:hypothetical protein
MFGKSANRSGIFSAIVALLEKSIPSDHQSQAADSS